MVRVIVDSDSGSESSRIRSAPGSEWSLLAAVGAVFGLVSLADLVLTMIPANFGSAEWEWGTATSVLNNLPLFTVGLTFVAAAGFGKRSAGLLRVAGVVFGLAFLFVVLMAVFFTRNLSEARASVTDPVLQLGLSRSATRTTVQLIAYVVGYALLGFKALRGASAV